MLVRELDTERWSEQHQQNQGLGITGRGNICNTEINTIRIYFKAHRKKKVKNNFFITILSGKIFNKLHIIFESDIYYKGH